MKRFNRLRGTPHRRWQCWNSGLHAVHVFVDSHQPLRDFEQEAVPYLISQHFCLIKLRYTMIHQRISECGAYPFQLLPLVQERRAIRALMIREFSSNYPASDFAEESLLQSSCSPPLLLLLLPELFFEPKLRPDKLLPNMLLFNVFRATTAT